MEASKSCTKITGKLFHAKNFSHLKKIWQNKEKQKQSKRKKNTTANQSEATVLAAVHTSHQVWCLQRL